MGLLEQSLLKPGKPVNDVVVRQLQAAAPRDVSDLLPHLEKRGFELAEGATLKLMERGDKEAQAMRTILEEQRKRISVTEKQSQQLTLGLFNADEVRQLEADRRHWERRLGDIERELASEPVRIRNVYVVKAKRIEPVGLVYLWPVTG
jgi:hypothetical protein